MHSKVSELDMYLLFLKFFSHLGYYRILSSNILGYTKGPSCNTAMF